jgi:hypothetical protein
LSTPFPFHSHVLRARANNYCVRLVKSSLVSRFSFSSAMMIYPASHYCTDIVLQGPGAMRDMTSWTRIKCQSVSESRVLSNYGKVNVVKPS